MKKRILTTLRRYWLVGVMTLCIINLFIFMMEEREIAELDIVSNPLLEYEDSRTVMRGEKLESDDRIFPYSDEMKSYIWHRLVVDDSKVNTNKVGKYIVTYKWLGYEAKQAVYVTDIPYNADYFIRLNGDEIVKIGLGEEFKDPGAYIYKRTFGNEGEIAENWSKEIYVKDQVNTSIPGIYEIHYNTPYGPWSKRLVYVLDENGKEVNVRFPVTYTEENIL